MNWTPKILATLTVIVAVAVFVLWVLKDGPPTPQPTGPEIVTSPTQLAPVIKRPGLLSPLPRPVATPTNETPLLPSPGSTNPITNWVLAIDELLRDDAGEPGAKAKQLLEMFPRLPAAGQVEAAQHIANLLADEDYGLLAKYFTSTNTAAEVREILLADLLGRPNAIKLPMLLEVARTPNHPGATEAREILGVYLDHDYGPDWDSWRRSLEEWLKANPD